jgi:hypothetical protein
MFDLYKTGSVIEFQADPDWDWSSKIKVDSLDYGFDGENRLYFVIRFRFSNDHGQRRGWRASGDQWESQTYVLKVVYPKDYPGNPPLAYLVEPARGWLSTPHMYPVTAELCLFRPDDGRSYGWDPSRSTGATIMSWAIQWVRAFRHWEREGAWPGEDGHTKHSLQW